MLYQVPSGSKSAGGFATGCVLMKVLRSATIVQLVPVTLKIWFGTVGTPCEQPAPERSP